MNSSESSDNCCPVCFRQLLKVSGSPDACEHEFCLECIFTWSDVSSICPIDRKLFHAIAILNEKKETISLATIKPKLPEPVEELYDFSSACEICENEKTGTLLLCDVCDLAFHTTCLKPPVKRIPEGEWICPNCLPILKVRKKRKSHYKGKKRRKRAPARASLSYPASFIPDFKSKHPISQISNSLDFNQVATSSAHPSEPSSHLLRLPKQLKSFVKSHSSESEEEFIIFNKTKFDSSENSSEENCSSSEEEVFMNKKHAVQPKQTSPIYETLKALTSKSSFDDQKEPSKKPNVLGTFPKCSVTIKKIEMIDV